MKFILILALALASSINIANANGFDDDYVSLLMKYASLQNEKLDQNESRDLTMQARGPFNCQIIPSTNPRPTSVHQLRPSDIEVIAAIGDSLTAANGAKASTILGLLEECRGVSWSMGGESADINRVVSLPNILRQYNPNLYGFSTGSGKASSTAAVFNVANPGDTSHEMYQQAVDLVNRMKASSRIDFLNSWKVVTFFVGGNDLCKSCKDINKYSVNNYVNNIKKTLDYFKANLPRTFVNLVLTLDVRGIQILTGTTCRNMQKTFCDCALTDSFLPTLDTLTKGYQKGVEDLIATGSYDTKDDFTVVLQPFMKLMKPPLKPDGTPNYSLFSPDCFHFSTAGHQIAAVELWNSMLTPVGRKPEKWTMSSNALCPSSNAPFLYTKKNSPIF